MSHYEPAVGPEAHTDAVPLARAHPATLRLLADCARHRQTGDAAGRPLYLLRTGLTVVPIQRRGHRWDCVVVDDGTFYTGAVISVNHVEIDTALTAPMGPPLGLLDADTYLTAWHLRVLNTWPDHRGMQTLAHLIARHLGKDAALTFTVGRQLRRQLRVAVNLRRRDGDRLLKILTDWRLLTPTTCGVASPDPAYTLALPGVPCHARSASVGTDKARPTSNRSRSDPGTP